ncbi:glycosyl transferase family 2 [Salinigranum rubrum]|uniref:Glycosyl transferase family 2 n=1 Tax=Salinigranum rubrum TaxID=755307 RepID=A0A2I8VLQ1_9EURY|nr:glycosyltransferase family 2 protein [Salinigranum rubrum]AUV82860.1 glycosyl transferase family 2 [Salinigranum rubrum]
MTTVSVVVPTYNCADVLPRTIESVLAQTLSDLELIVVDDASTDETESVVSGYDDPRIRYVRHPTNRGGSAARNTGIANARGTYVAFLDADDEWYPRKLERQVDCLTSRGDEWVAAYCGFDRIRNGRLSGLRGLIATRVGGRENTRKEGGAELVADSLLLRGFSTGGMSTLVVERVVVDAMDGFDESFQRRQDWEFRTRLLKRGKLAYVDEILVRKHGSGKPSAETVERASLHFLDTFAADVATLEQRGHVVVGRHLFEVAVRHYADGNFRRGTSYLRRSHVTSVRQCLSLGFGLTLGVRTTLRRLARRTLRGASSIRPDPR